MTAAKLRRVVVGYPAHVVRAAVEAALRECPTHQPEVPDMAALVAFWLMEEEGWEWFAPPLPEGTVEAIYRRLRSAAH